MPPPGVVLRADDGTLYTGVVIVERNSVVFLLAHREVGPTSHRDHETSPYPTRFGSRGLFEQPPDDEPRWPR
ncbi:MAG: hypothetical protein IPJ34_13415 [Myxococcales bacterium]|nr:hypothetical protein [Myxococcales bacterium]